MNTKTPPAFPYAKAAFFFIAGLTLIRLTGLIASPLNLHGDEAQYWAWSRDFDFGYFSKPPMIAWLIGSTTAVFGSAEWAVRLSSPLLHGLTGLVLYFAGRKLGGPRTGLFAAMIYLLMPGVFLSSGIISTDVPLLLCWSIGLLAVLQMREAASWRWAIVLGAAIGAGMLSKYAMLFFIPPLVLGALIETPTRKAMLSRYGLAVLIIAAVVISPNIWWNVQNEFATVAHTAENTNMRGGIPFHPLKLVEFWGSQLGVFGPLTFVLLIAALVTVLRKRADKTALVLAMFVLVPLLVISVQALLSRANANWAVSAYPAGALLLALIMSKSKWLKGGLWVNAGLGAVLSLAALSPAFADWAGMANSFKRVRAWPQTIDHIAKLAAKGDDGQAYTAIATDNRIYYYGMLYYDLAGKSVLPLKVCVRGDHPNNHAELTSPLLGGTDGPILIISYYNDVDSKASLARDFESVDKLPEFRVDLGGGKQRIIRPLIAQGYKTQDQ